MNPDTQGNIPNQYPQNPQAQMGGYAYPQGSVPQQPNMAYQQGQPVIQGQQVAVPVKTNPNSTQNTLLINEIRDGVVIMTDGSFRSVVMLKSINFDLMSPQERESVEYAYQGFFAKSRSWTLYRKAR
jgi:hypothetical protein